MSGTTPNFWDDPAHAARSSFSAPRATIRSASSGEDRCSVFASSHGAARPGVAFLFGREDHRHCLLMDRFNDRVSRRQDRSRDISGLPSLIPRDVAIDRLQQSDPREVDRVASLGGVR